ncbi:helix-turn-helix transcriptional regulator [Streptomyces sp. 549]|uniref:helix-turn-helix transcriptional regulator n=1 Tax=Streptomyces sp. 549 TaxID=3049076 RepID=UPI0024C2898D|nr:helix-turn-helix transcriptional regulator [Streptomyces sp. 549]MDK1474301.1 helix-turn-helix transcriptional regulator [Streptomyces sp. 549]
MYRERRSGLGDGTVVWSRAALPAEGPAAAPAAGSVRVLPDGCMDLIWHDGALLVAGPDTRAHVSAGAPDGAWAGLRFPPGVGPAVFGVPASELRDLRVPLDAVWPAARVRRLTGQVNGSADRGAALEEVAADAGGTPDPLCRAVADALGRGRPVSEVARDVGLSERQLHRRALRSFGYGPKTLARVLRLERALALARTGRPPADVAAATGFADQAHLARDVKALAGVPLGELLG